MKLSSMHYSIIITLLSMYTSAQAQYDTGSFMWDTSQQLLIHQPSGQTFKPDGSKKNNIVTPLISRDEKSKQENQKKCRACCEGCREHACWLTGSAAILTGAVLIAVFCCPCPVPCPNYIPTAEGLSATSWQASTFTCGSNTQITIQGNPFNDLSRGYQLWNRAGDYMENLGYGVNDDVSTCVASIDANQINITSPWFYGNVQRCNTTAAEKPNGLKQRLFGRKKQLIKQDQKAEDKKQK